MGPYLNDKGRANFQLTLSPCSGCRGEMRNETCLLFRLCNTLQTTANLAAADNKQNEKKLRESG